jgi:hypothetical protein
MKIGAWAISPSCELDCNISVGVTSRQKTMLMRAVAACKKQLLESFNKYTHTSDTRLLTYLLTELSPS